VGRTAPDTPSVGLVLRGGGGVVLLLAVAALFVDPRQAAAIGAGAVVSLINFLWIRRHLGLLLSVTPRVAPVLSTLRFLLRVAVLGVTVYLLLVYGKLPVTGLLIGLSAPVVGSMFHLASHLRKGGSSQS